MKAEKRIYRTEDGRLVYEGDPDAAFLVYPAGEEIEAGDRDKLPGATKSKTPQANKSRSKPADK